MRMSGPGGRCDLHDTRRPPAARTDAARTDAGRAAVAWLLAVVLVVAGGGYAAYYYGYLDRYLCDGGTCSGLDVLPPEQLDLPAARKPRPVLRDATGPHVSARKVREAVHGLLRDKDLGGHVGFAVRDLTHGEDVWSYGKRAFTPASTLKLFTSLAALETVGPGATFTTSVTRDGHDLTLVGGGDPYLATKPPERRDHVYPERATLSLLATRTANALKHAGIDSVRLAYDDSLFTGPAVNPHWEDDYISDDVTTPVSALWVDEGVSADTGRRSRRPARDATDAFAHALEKRGVTVRGKTRRDTHAQNETVARVRSAPLEQIVQSLLERSDNDAAEVVLRHAAIAAGEPASFAGGVDAVRQTLTAMGIPWQGNKMFDGSGLARGDKVTLASLLGVLQQAAARDETGGLLDDLPVAGFSGSLAGRFTGPGTDPGLGVVRAKTGTLSGVHSLAGVTVDADGTVLAFVLMTDKVRLPDTLDARATLDRVAATLTACACGR